MKNKKFIIASLCYIGTPLVVGSSLGAILGEHFVYESVVYGKIRPTRLAAYTILFAWFVASISYAPNVAEDVLDFIDECKDSDKNKTIKE